MTQRILVVDDEPGICHALRSVLLDEAYSVETAMSAKAALNKLAVAPFDLAIVDLYLPVVNGLQLAEAIRFLRSGAAVDQHRDAGLVLYVGYCSAQLSRICRA